MHYRTMKEQIKPILEKKHWEWADLAEKLGFSPSRMSHIINGEQRVTTDSIEGIAKALGVEATYFDLYIVKKLPDYAMSAPVLIDIGRSLATAKTTAQFAKIAAKVAS